MKKNLEDFFDVFPLFVFKTEKKIGLACSQFKVLTYWISVEHQVSIHRHLIILIEVLKEEQFLFIGRISYLF